MIRIHLRTVLPASTALSLGMLGLGLQFTEAARAEDSDVGTPLEEIVVTARRIEERLQDVPISITVFDQRQLDERNVVNAQDLADYTPSLSVNSNSGPANSTFAIRGFVQDQGTPPSVGVYFADVVAPRAASQGTPVGDGAGPGQFFDLQNVQVLKGPQGTLFGRNTTGGAILLVPQKPTSLFGGYLEGSYGNYDMERIQGAVNVPINDVLRFRLAFDHQTRNGDLSNNSGIGPSTFDDIDYNAVRASLDFDITPDLENYTIASYNHSDSNGDIQKIIACNPTPSRANFLGTLACAQLAAEKGTGFYTVQNDWSDPQSTLTQWRIINTTTWHASDTLTIKNIASYAQLKDIYSTGLFGTNFKLGPTTLPFVAVNPLPGGPTADSSTATEELQIQGSAADQRLTYQSGVYFEATEPLSVVGNLSPLFASCTNLAALHCTPLLPGTSSLNYTAGRTRYRDVGVYTQESYKLTSQLTLTGGLRYTWDRVDNTTDRITYSLPALNVAVPHCTDSASTVLPACTEVLEQTSHAPTWLIDLDYKPMDDVLLYGKYARGYRSGGIFPNSPSNYRVFQPEKVDDFELGAKTTFGGDLHGVFDIDGFYNNFRNQQLEADFNAAPGVAVSPTTGVVNAGKSRIYGVEVNASISPFRGLTLDGSYTYLNAKIISIAPLVSTDPHYVISDTISPGDPLELAPKNKVTLTSTYTLPLNQSVGRVSVGATFTHTDKQFSTYLYNSQAYLALYGSNLGELAARNLLNLNMSWSSVAGLPIDASIFVTNVTNRQYYSYVPGLGSNGFESAVLGEPRMYGAKLRYRFGG